MPAKPFTLAIVGATGAVGRTVLEVLEDRDLPLTELRLLASARSAGQELEVRGEPYKLIEAGAAALRGCDVVVLCASAEVSRALAPLARQAGAAVVDGTGAFRDDPQVPCVVPEVNGAALAREGLTLVAAPGALATALALALKPLHEAAGLERVVCDAALSASAGGRAGVEQLERETADLLNGREPQPPAPFPFRVAFNLLAHAGTAVAAAEEAAAGGEVARLLGLPGLPISTTAMVVPIFHGHVAALHLGLLRPLSLEAARAALQAAPGVKVVDAQAEGVFPMPMLAVNDDALLAGRLRADPAFTHGLSLVVAIDNLRRGAATNLVGLAEAMAGRR